MKNLTFGLVICMIAAFVFAADTERIPRQAASERNVQQPEPRVPAPVSALRNQSRNRQQTYLQVQARRAETHAKGIAELEAIKKIAQEEGAVKTVEAIETLITQKNTEFKEVQAQLETQRAQRARQIQRQAQQERPERLQRVGQNNDAAENPNQNDN